MNYCFHSAMYMVTFLSLISYVEAFIAKLIALIKYLIGTLFFKVNHVKNTINYK